MKLKTIEFKLKDWLSWIAKIIWIHYIWEEDSQWIIFFAKLLKINNWEIRFWNWKIKGDEIVRTINYS